MRFPNTRAARWDLTQSGSIRSDSFKISQFWSERGTGFHARSLLLAHELHRARCWVALNYKGVLQTRSQLDQIQGDAKKGRLQEFNFCPNLLRYFFNILPVCFQYTWDTLCPICRLYSTFFHFNMNFRQFMTNFLKFPNDRFSINVNFSEICVACNFGLPYFIYFIFSSLFMVRGVLCCVKLKVISTLDLFIEFQTYCLVSFAKIAKIWSNRWFPLNLVTLVAIFNIFQHGMLNFTIWLFKVPLLISLILQQFCNLSKRIENCR